MNATDLCFTPATELVTMIRAKQLSPVELTRAVLERIERVNPTLNAFCTLTADTALARARDAEAAVMGGGPLGPLHGISYSIKDLAFTRGVRTMSGSHIFATRVPDVDAPFVRRLHAAGGVMLGKTTSPEFGWKALGDSPLTGITRNPWNTAMTTGGSSAGAAAAAAAGLGPLAHGSDGAGSIRIPSSFCGVYGLKPTYGRVPMWPISNNDYASHNGPMTRTVGDAALMLSRMDPGLVASIEDGLRYSATEYIEARGEKLAYCDSVRPLFEKYDLLLTPSVSVTAFEVGRLNPAHWPQHAWDWFPWAGFSYPFNFTGHPAASVPAGVTAAGMPVGLQIVGRRNADLTVLQASAAFEQARPWAQRRPLH